jgi:type VI secretion system protein ImpB
MGESKQQWVSRNRPPRVQITYDVETGGAIAKKEIPFVVGVASGLSGDTAPSQKLKERKFVQIDRDNFNDVMASICPTLSFTVDDRLRDGDAKLKVDLTFKGIDDFRPESIAEQVAPLASLLSARRRLVDLLAKIEGNDELSKSLLALVSDEAKLEAVKKEALGS